MELVINRYDLLRIIKLKMKKIVIFIITLFSPLIALGASHGAQPQPSTIVTINTGSGLGRALVEIGNIISGIIPIIVALALLFFFFGLAKYILSAGDEEKKSQGRSIMIWGIIALFVMVSVWGLVRLVQETFDLQDSPTRVPAPGININPGTSSTR
jgi:hypothetical protein